MNKATCTATDNSGDLTCGLIWPLNGIWEPPKFL